MLSKARMLESTTHSVVQFSEPRYCNLGGLIERSMQLLWHFLAAKCIIRLSAEYRIIISIIILTETHALFRTSDEDTKSNDAIFMFVIEHLTSSAMLFCLHDF